MTHSLHASPSSGDEETSPPHPVSVDGGCDSERSATDMQAEVLQQFRVVFNAVKTHFQRVERQAGVGGAQIWALSVIRDRPDIGVGDLAEALNVRQPTASILVRGLTDHALITHTRRASDRRAVLLRVTPKGDELLRTIPAPHAGILPDALASLDDETLTRLAHDLAVLIQRLQVDPEARKRPLASL